MSRFMTCLLGWLVMTTTVRGQADEVKPPVKSPGTPIQRDERPAPRIADDTKTPVKSTATLSVDRDKMRNALDLLPRGSMFIEMGNLPWGLGEKIPGKAKTFSKAERIESLKKELNGTAADAEVYLRLSESYEDKTASGEAGAKAAELFPKRIAQDPRNGWLWAQYSTALLTVDKAEAAESAAAKAIELAPNDWRCWQASARLRMTQMNRTLRGSEKPLPWSFCADLVDETLNRKPPQNDLDKAERYLREAGKCFDKEVECAPNEPEVYRERIGFYWWVISLRAGLPKPFCNDTDKNPAMKVLPEVLHDGQQLARLCPNDLDIQGFLASVAFNDAWSKVGDKINLDKASAVDASPTEGLKASFEALPLENKKIIREATAKFAKRARQKDFPEAASRTLAMLSFFQGDLKTAVRQARRAVRLGPKAEQNWDLLEMVLN